MTVPSPPNLETLAGRAVGGAVGAVAGAALISATVPVSAPILAVGIPGAALIGTLVKPAFGYLGGLADKGEAKRTLIQLR